MLAFLSLVEQQPGHQGQLNLLLLALLLPSMPKLLASLLLDLEMGTLPMLPSLTLFLLLARMRPSSVLSPLLLPP
uniref:Uncharacterized protein n=1 Tax=Picea glauca TaxID=3330 RepID=A0A117NIQ8_PICGL|nr:hypothetical protein ABT39_MTgene189 [Picea glauca]QHR89326.1 hypothetical protein Q903MT_gene3347 [Picea sitchensis]